MKTQPRYKVSEDFLHLDPHSKKPKPLAEPRVFFKIRELITGARTACRGPDGKDDVIFMRGGYYDDVRGKVFDERIDAESALKKLLR